MRASTSVGDIRGAEAPAAIFEGAPGGNRRFSRHQLRLHVALILNKAGESHSFSKSRTLIPIGFFELLADQGLGVAGESLPHSPSFAPHRSEFRERCYYGEKPDTGDQQQNFVAFLHRVSSMVHGSKDR